MSKTSFGPCHDRSDAESIRLNFTQYRSEEGRHQIESFIVGQLLKWKVVEQEVFGGMPDDKRWFYFAIGRHIGRLRFLAWAFQNRLLWQWVKMMSWNWLGHIAQRVLISAGGRARANAHKINEDMKR